MTFVAPLGLTVENSVLRDELATDLAAVEDLLRRSCEHDNSLIDEMSRHLMSAGGKRFRPLLVLLAAQFGDRQLRDRAVRAAAVMELTHLASLYHDDVMDSATIRRGVASANEVWGNKVSVLTGDLLFAKATMLIAGLGDEAIQIQANTAARLIAGQIRETVGPADGVSPVEHYRSVLRDKTGSLIATSCRLGALLTAAPPTAVDALGRFGELIGLCFQLGDDLLDVVSDSDESGKTPGTDMREGVPTLPVLYALESTDPSDEYLRELLQGDLDDESRLTEALKLLRAHPAVDRTRAELARCVDEARALLPALPDVPARDSLRAVCDAALWRTA